MLDRALERRPVHGPSETIERRLRDSAARDVAELLPRLQERANDAAARAEEQLRSRGDAESRRLREILEAQRTRVRAELERHDSNAKQLTLDFDEGERRQHELDVRSWRHRLTQFDSDLATEPARIEDFYVVRARRVEPVGLVYLWPDTN